MCRAIRYKGHRSCESISNDKNPALETSLEKDLSFEIHPSKVGMIKKQQQGDEKVSTSSSVK